MNPNLLLIEDSETDAKLITHQLTRSLNIGLRSRVDDEQALRAALGEQRWDVVLCDWSMPGLTAMRALDIVKKTQPEAIFILVSGTIGEELAVDAMRAGASDYVLKDRLARLVPAIERELRDREQGRQLRALALRQKRLFDTNIIGTIAASLDGEILDANDAFLEMVGCTREEMEAGLVDWARMTPPEHGISDAEAIEALKRAGRYAPYEKEYVRRDGTRVPVMIAGALDGQRSDRAVAFVLDLSEKKSAERQQLRFQALIERSHEIFALVDRDLNFLYCSPSIAEVLGEAPRDAPARRGLLVHSDDSDARASLLSRCLAQPGAPVRGELRILHRDGGVRWMAVTLTNLLDDPAVGGIVCNLHDVTEQRNALEELRASQARLMRLWDSGILGICVGDLDGNIDESNEAFCRMLGFSRDEMLAEGTRWAALTPPEWNDVDARAIALLRRDGVAPQWEKELVGRDGQRVPVLVGAAMLDERRCIAWVLDLTEPKRAENALRAKEEQFRAAQKMEAVGRLAGGVAHDFNNLLSVILSYSELIAADLKSADPMRADVDEIHSAAQRATHLTRQLLAFSRQQVLQPKIIDINQEVEGMGRMLRRLIGEDIELVVGPAPDLAKVKMDPNQLGQVLMNLAVNARDAMPEGGKLTIETSNVGGDVLLSVSDDGVGMDGSTQSRIFEPFFTTKEKGKGTGLGLSTVFGIVQQSGGSIEVESAPGRGTAFRIRMPALHPSLEEAGQPSRLSGGLRGTETVLLVEDDESLRSLARTILRKHGYQVLETQTVGDAMLVCEQHVGKIHLLLTDVVMPRMGGPQLAARLTALRPDMRVLYMSGYTDDAILRSGVLDQRVAFLVKPFTPDLLTRKVRDVLDRG